MTGKEDTRVHFDSRVAEALRSAEADPVAAEELLRIAADYLRRDEPLPWGLSGHLARAFEAAVSTPAMPGRETERDKRLLRGLNLRSAGGARPKRGIDFITIGREAEEVRELYSGSQDTKVSEEVALRIKDRTGISISPATVLKLERQYVAAMRASDDALGSDLEENGK